VAYWCAARLQPHRESLALHCLSLAGFEAYYPRVADRRIRHGRRVVLTPALFPGYAFVLIRLQWHAARWAPGTLGLIMDGIQPAKLPDPVRTSGLKTGLREGRAVARQVIVVPIVSCRKLLLQRQKRQKRVVHHSRFSDQCLR